MKRLYFTILLAAASVAAFAQQKYEQGKPNNEAYRYLDEYRPLKEYIDRKKYPNFKLGAGTTVNEYLNNRNEVFNRTNDNFNETVAGNAMKMASCVNNNGVMNFSTVKNYVNKATAAGLSVYGHTLAWHSQQPKGWLLSLLADVPAEDLEDGDVSIWMPVANKDFRVQQNVGWKAPEADYGYSIQFDKTDGLKVTTTKSYPWEVQFVIMSDINLKKGKKHKMIMTVKGSKAGRLDGRVGDWNGGANVTIPFTTEWQDVEVTLTPTMESSFFLVHVPNYVGDVYVKSIRFEQEKFAKLVTEKRRCLQVKATAKTNDETDNQLIINTGTFPTGATFELTGTVLADKAAKASTMTQNSRGTGYCKDAIGDINFAQAWTTFNISGNFSVAGKSLILNLSKFEGENTYYFDDLSLKINGEERIINGNFEGADLSSFQTRVGGGDPVTPEICKEVSYLYIPSSRPLTPEEKHDALVIAMEKWIRGMMEACDGKVKAWDLVNEAISGGGNDGEGNYELQHSEGYKSGTWDVGGDAFYWQDYMGDLEYVRQACNLARQYGPEGVKLFINDYNLESTWDDNKKLKSLINWIKKWESDGVTKIDGIGTQMHISYLLNKEQQEKQKQCITRMFELMAATGKLVRVSELDMGMCERQFGPGFKTADLTEEQHKMMADYYEWIIKEYLRIVPPAQQWGICQWCTTDAPGSSGWRGGEPVGIWDLDGYRKHTYAGFVRGLGGVDAIEEVEADKVASSRAIFDLQGRRFTNVSDVNSLPSGLYIVGGKKVFVK